MSDNDTYRSCLTEELGQTTVISPDEEVAILDVCLTYNQAA